MTDFSRVKQNLEARGFRVSVFATAAEAADYLDSAIDNTSVGFGGSAVMAACRASAPSTVGRQCQLTRSCRSSRS